MKITTIDPASGTEVTLRLAPVLDQQELTGALSGISYWEGACTVTDVASGRKIGRAYLELVGYSTEEAGRRGVRKLRSSAAQRNASAEGERLTLPIKASMFPAR